MWASEGRGGGGEGMTRVMERVKKIKIINSHWLRFLLL